MYYDITIGIQFGIDSQCKILFIWIKYFLKCFSNLELEHYLILEKKSERTGSSLIRVVFNSLLIVKQVSFQRNKSFSLVKYNAQRVCSKMVLIPKLDVFMCNSKHFMCKSFPSIIAEHLAFLKDSCYFNYTVQQISSLRLMLNEVENS